MIVLLPLIPFYMPQGRYRAFKWGMYFYMSFVFTHIIYVLSFVWIYNICLSFVFHTYVPLSLEFDVSLEKNIINIYIYIYTYKSVSFECIFLVSANPLSQDKNMLTTPSLL